MISVENRKSQAWIVSVGSNDYYIDSSSYSNFEISYSFPNTEVNNTYYWENRKNKYTRKLVVPKFISSGNDNAISDKTLNSGGLFWGIQISYLNNKVNCFRIVFSIYQKCRGDLSYIDNDFSMFWTHLKHLMK